MAFRRCQRGGARRTKPEDHVISGRARPCPILATSPNWDNSSNFNGRRSACMKASSPAMTSQRSGLSGDSAKVRQPPPLTPTLFSQHIVTR
jgi:hypothetical protein